MIQSTNPAPQPDLDNVTAADIPRLVAELRQHRRLTLEINRSVDAMPHVRIEYDGVPVLDGRLEGPRLA